MNIKIWEFLITCYKCDNKIEVLWPEDIDLELVAEELASRGYPRIKQVYSHTRNEVVWGNTCPQCGAYQGNHFVMEEYLDMRNGPPTFWGHPKVIETIDVDLPCSECGNRSEDAIIVMSNYFLCTDCNAKRMNEMAEQKKRDTEEKKKRLATLGVECPICNKRVLPETMTNHLAANSPEQIIRICMSCNRKSRRSTNHFPTK
jgi:DNA-directed RNA polymerase subunit M/transcription elongation factor TFIIS